MTNRSTTSNRRSRRNYDIFISWSGDDSKEIALALKDVLEQKVFVGNSLSCFVSDQNISSGTEWWNTVKTSLKVCKVGIICVTKGNSMAPWVHYEAGAMVAHNIPVIPLLFHCDFSTLSATPLNNKQAVQFYDERKFLQMLCDIYSYLNYSGMNDDQIKYIGKEAYSCLRANLSTVFTKLKNTRVFNTKYVYPKSENVIQKNTIFMSAQMSCLTDHDEYSELHDFLARLNDTLLKNGFTEVYCPMLEVDDPTCFDGEIKAIRKNFPRMKRADSMIIILPHNLPSSALVESGYAIALSKNTVIFHREGVPYILKDAGSEIQHLKVYSFKDYDEIMEKIEADGKALFEGEVLD